MKKNFVSIVVLLFLTLTVLIYGIKLYAIGYSYKVFFAGNTIMALLSLVSFYIVTRQMNSKPDAFVRGVYASSFLKLFVCMIAILVYVMINRPYVHKPSLFVLFGIYAVYSIVETWLLSRLAKEVK